MKIEIGFGFVHSVDKLELNLKKFKWEEKKPSINV